MGAHVAQSVVYVWPSTTEGASTTLVRPQSHTDVFARVMSDEITGIHGAWGAHYVELRALRDKTLAAELLAGFLAHGRRIPVPAGSVLFWNSRTMHQGHSGGARLAAPVCWEPKARRSEMVRAHFFKELFLPEYDIASLYMVSFYCFVAKACARRPGAAASVERRRRER